MDGAAQRHDLVRRHDVCRHVREQDDAAVVVRRVRAAIGLDAGADVAHHLGQARVAADREHERDPIA